MTSAVSPTDTIDIVRDPISPGEYKPEEDPKLYHSSKTGRGPLGDDWLEAAVASGPLMCAYKLCKVEFRYWGMQSKIEQFIHDVGEFGAVGCWRVIWAAMGSHWTRFPSSPPRFEEGDAARPPPSLVLAG